MSYANLFHERMLKNEDLIIVWGQPKFFERLDYVVLMRIDTRLHFSKDMKIKKFGLSLGSRFLKAECLLFLK